MGLFKKNKNDFSVTHVIYPNSILYDINQKTFLIKNGFSKTYLLSENILDIGISYGSKIFFSNDINIGKTFPGGLEKYFSGEYELKTIPALSIVFKDNDNKTHFYPLTINKTSPNQRFLIIAEEIYDKIKDLTNL